MLVQQLLGDFTEGIAFGRAGHFLQAALNARILAIGEQLARGVTAVAGFGEGHLRVGPRAMPFCFPSKR